MIIRLKVVVVVPEKRDYFMCTYTSNKVFAILPHSVGLENM